MVVTIVTLQDAELLEGRFWACLWGRIWLHWRGRFTTNVSGLIPWTRGQEEEDSELITRTLFSWLSHGGYNVTMTTNCVMFRPPWLLHNKLYSQTVNQRKWSSLRSFLKGVSVHLWMHVWVCVHACVFMCTHECRCPLGLVEDFRSPGNGTTVDCECWEFPGCL